MKTATYYHERNQGKQSHNHAPIAKTTASRT